MIFLGPANSLLFVRHLIRVYSVRVKVKEKVVASKCPRFHPRNVHEGPQSFASNSPLEQPRFCGPNTRKKVCPTSQQRRAVSRSKEGLRCYPPALPTRHRLKSRCLPEPTLSSTSVSTSCHVELHYTVWLGWSRSAGGRPTSSWAKILMLPKVLPPLGACMP